MGKPYFRGWYFKLQNQEETIAFIPAKHTDASLQIITKNTSYCVPFEGRQYKEYERPFCVRLGHNVFGEMGIELNIVTSALTVQGRVTFQNWSPLAYDIMGPFCFVPFMECRHSVRSMAHRVDGYIVINGKQYVFKNGRGYIEGDRGRSFPKEYVWTQCHFEDAGPCSLMLSVADIPLAGMHFTGVISAILWRGREYRLATYLGARAVCIGEGRVVIRQGPYTLTAQLLERGGHTLQAPVAGDMSRRIRESAACKARYSFSRHGQVLFALDTDRAAFEYEYTL